MIFGSSETVKFVMVPITQDSIFEGEESFTATLSPAPDSSGVEIGQQGTATTTIVDGSHLVIKVIIILSFVPFHRYINILLFSGVCYS